MDLPNIPASIFYPCVYCKYKCEHCDYLMQYGITSKLHPDLVDSYLIECVSCLKFKCVNCFNQSYHFCNGCRKMMLLDTYDFLSRFKRDYIEK